MWSFRLLRDPEDTADDDDDDDDDGDGEQLGVDEFVSIFFYL